MNRLLLVGLVSLLFTQVFGNDLEIYRESTKVGSAKTYYKYRDNGTLYVQIKMEVTLGGATVVVTHESNYDKDGNPTRKYFRMTGSNVSKMIQVTFQNRVANVIVEEGTGRKTFQIPAPEKSEIRMKSEFWFVNTTPKVNEEWKCYRFSIDDLKWVETKVVYLGKENISIRDKKFDAHKVQQDNAIVWVDEKKDIIRMVQDSLRFERKI
jgi:hypothetical protein